MYYFTFVFLMLFLTFIENSYKKAIFLSFFLFFLFLGFSYPSGYDFVGYFTNYNCLVNHTCNSDNLIKFESGYNLLVLIFGQLGYQLTIVAIAIFNVVCVFKFIQKNKIGNGSFVFFVLLTMLGWVLYIEAIRQAMAMSIFLYAIQYLYTKKIAKYVFFVLLSTMFHSSAIITLLFIFSVVVKSRWIIYLSGMVMLIVYLLFITIPNEIIYGAILFFKLLPDFIGNTVVEKLNFYMMSDAYKPQVSIGIGAIIDFSLVCLFIIALRDLKNNIHDETYNRGFNITLVGIFFYVFFAMLIGRYMPVLTRIGWFGIPFIIILFSQYFRGDVFYKIQYHNRWQRVIRILIVSFLCMQSCRPLVYDYSGHAVLNQQSIFENMNGLDDKSLEKLSHDKCVYLSNIGYGYLCGW
mgnify:CR=1 FL=1